MSATTDVIEAARKLVASAREGWPTTVEDDALEGLDAALKAYDARRAEMSAMPITGGG
ncbi:MAG: hypothetical protein QOG73_1702 [Acetobacteraceae bacterium]|jgi:hypothetical protein|nr:hypothetical protein [Acetobacteraceae bacterium]